MAHGRLVELVPRYIEVVGRLTLSGAAKAKAKANRARAEAEAFKLTHLQRQYELARKKQEAKLAAQEALSPKAREKKEEKDRKKALQKGMGKMKMTKAH
mmetsp:Transcript_14846/g.31887  ORF Transcript_14846/g.31887 Transcript_14846/m.31887 type:complete len:99 (+) Transcript_14846:254-550(+)